MPLRRGPGAGHGRLAADGQSRRLLLRRLPGLRRTGSAAPICSMRKAAATSSRSRRPRLRSLQGQHRIVGLRLTPKGLFRWYASCCNTPVGNTLTPAIPFVGIVAQGFDQATHGPTRSSARRSARSSASMRSARRRRARPASTCRCCCARSARCSAGACADKRGRTRSSSKARASRSIRSRCCRGKSARRSARCADRIPTSRSAAR